MKPMKLPNREKAYIPPQKLTGYLLSETHSVGKSKAKFFRAFGFHEQNLELFEQRLLTIAHSEDVKEVSSSGYGTKYVIDGTLETPVGTVVAVRTVWILEFDQDRPRFVTAHPL